MKARKHASITVTQARKHAKHKSTQACPAHKSNNINKVIRVVLNSLFIFYKKISYAPKAPKARKAQKAKKAQKAQRRNQAKVQNATSVQK